MFNTVQCRLVHFEILLTAQSYKESLLKTDRTGKL